MIGRILPRLSESCDLVGQKNVTRGRKNCGYLGTEAITYKLVQSSVLSSPRVEDHVAAARRPSDELF